MHCSAPPVIIRQLGCVRQKPIRRLFLDSCLPGFLLKFYVSFSPLPLKLPDK